MCAGCMLAVVEMVVVIVTAVVVVVVVVVVMVVGIRGRDRLLFVIYF